MHDYSIDKHPKEKILFTLAFIAIAAAPVINVFTKNVVTSLNAHTGWSLPFVTAIPIFTLFIVIYCLFNNYLWKMRILRKILLIPDLNGTWSCKGRTFLKNGTQIDFPWEGTITINQSWSKICIILTTKTSRSYSVAASLFQESTGEFRLIYHYENKPAADAIKLNKHEGTAEFMFDAKCKMANGYYYADRNRQSSGTISISKDDGK
ncbi:MAG: hypothetical protein WAT67_01050 [Candidatus Contendobacter sp.]